MNDHKLNNNQQDVGSISIKNGFRSELDILRVDNNIFNYFIILNTLIVTSILISSGLFIFNIFYIGYYDELTSVMNFLEFFIILLYFVEILTMPNIIKKHKNISVNNKNNLEANSIQKNKFALTMFKISTNSIFVYCYLIFEIILVLFQLLLILTRIDFIQQIHLTEIIAISNIIFINVLFIKK